MNEDCSEDQCEGQICLVDDSHKYTIVTCKNEIGPGGAHHNYQIIPKGPGFKQVRIDFQNGPILEAGVNGIMNEDLLSILIDRMEGFQSGKYACLANEAALNFLKAALKALKLRTGDREKRGVEGTHKL